MPEYPKVKKAHIVPRMYLAKWAVAGKIGVRLVREDETLVQPIENVGIRRSFYRRHRPDGTEIEDVEWTLSEISPPVGSGSFLPLSAQLLHGYTPEAAARSQRRAATSAEIQPKIGRDLSDQEVTIVKVSRDPAG